MLARRSATSRSTRRAGQVGSATLALSAVALILASCGATADGDPDPGAEPAGDRLTVVTTVAPITSIAANIIGDRARVVGIVPEGRDSHTFVPTPSVAELLAGADVVFVNGLQLDEPVTELAEANVAAGVPIVRLGDATIDPEDYLFDAAFPEREGRPNPHLWTDPTLATGYADAIRTTMRTLDPGGATVYDANHAAFVDLVGELDAAIVRAIDTIPADRRRLVTYHDAYAYFAATYGLRLVGAVQPADFGEPTPAEVVALIEQIEREQVPAIFGSEAFPSPVLEQIAAETGAAYVDHLRDDDLPGLPGDVEHSWLGLMRANLITITTALGGDPTALEELAVRDVTPDLATYPR